MKACRPATMSAIRRPVTGPLVMPLWPCPKASKRLGYPRALPITGKLSGRHGRWPIHSVNLSTRTRGYNSRTCSSNRRARRYTGGASSARELDSARDAQSFLHRRRIKLRFSHSHRQLRINAGIGDGHLITTLGLERNADAEWREQLARPCSGRQDRRARRRFSGRRPTRRSSRRRRRDSARGLLHVRFARHRPQTAPPATSPADRDWRHSRDPAAAHRACRRAKAPAPARASRRR